MPDKHRSLYDWALPIVLLLIYFFFYNQGIASTSGFIKTSGLVGILLLSITLFIGPASRFIQSLNIEKEHRKFWGIASVAFITVHAFLVINTYFHYNLFMLVDFSRPKFPGLFSGLVSLLILFVVTATSYQFIMRHLEHATWKKIQNASYIALLLALMHFFLMEQKTFPFTFKYILETIPFWLGTCTVVLRVIVYFFPKNTNVPSTNTQPLDNTNEKV